MSHTILLLQPTEKIESRTWSDYESTKECLEHICRVYEEHLKRNNPNSHAITYDVDQLFDFVDRMKDVACLIQDQDTLTYVPKNKDWIKRSIYELLRDQAAH